MGKLFDDVSYIAANCDREILTGGITISGNPLLPNHHTIHNTLIHLNVNMVHLLVFLFGFTMVGCSESVSFNSALWFFKYWNLKTIRRWKSTANEMYPSLFRFPLPFKIGNVTQ